MPRKGQREPRSEQDAAKPAKAAKPSLPRADPELLDHALVAVHEQHLLHHLFRWTALTGAAPTPEDWADAGDWPTPEDVDQVYGSWDEMLHVSGLQTGALTAAVEQQKAASAEVERMRKALERDQLAARKARDKDEERGRELRRQLDQARVKREEEADGRALAEGRAERAERRGAELEARVAELEGQVSAAAVVGPAPVSEVAAPEGDELLDALARENAGLRDGQEALLRQVEEATRANEEQAATLRHLRSRFEGAAAAEADEPAPAPEDAPGSVLEATQRAAAAAHCLRFAPAAFESADASPFRRPDEVLDDLRSLDELCGLYLRPDGFGQGLARAAADRGLVWRPNVSDLARGRWPDHYTVTWEGHDLALGPHVCLGKGAGAQFVARIYLHIADGAGEVPRGFYVGHVGRHLPDTTT